MRVLYTAIFLAWIASLWATHSWSVDHGAQQQQKLDQQERDRLKQQRDDARNERDAAASGLSALRVTLDAKTRAMQAQAHMFQAVMADRDRLQRLIDQRNQQAHTDLLKAAHEAPDCAALARLPLCPAVAERLWGSAANQPVQAARGR
ncbi:MAG: hypothetical protein AB1832_01135 [Pseudomonadota bacterium]